MATTTLYRRPLAPRALQLQFPSYIPQQKTVRIAPMSTKRPHSPEVNGDSNAIQATPPKRARGIQPSSMQVSRDPRERELRKAQREERKAEFRVKYTRAFPSWVFYFDLDTLDPQSAASRRILENKVSSLGARIDVFFSNEVTHLITNQPIPINDVGNKENTPKPRHSPLKPMSSLQSPIKGRTRVTEESSIARYGHLVTKAMDFGMKIWSTAKLDSVLERCLAPIAAEPSTLASSRVIAPPSGLSAATNTQRPLSRLLQSERLHGTHERDPTQKRHDFSYFSRSSYFVLVEDLRQELATIAAFEYIAVRNSAGKQKATWPVLHCHPYSRGPFIEFNEREKRRWQKSLMADSSEVHEAEETCLPVMTKTGMHGATRQLHAMRGGDLRRSVSMNNLHRRAAHTTTTLYGMVDLDPDNQDSANASGYLASTGTGGAYMAASGNSVGITSTTGTTSNHARNSLRNLQLSAALRGRIQQQVITSRKYPADASTQAKATFAMGPPDHIPNKPTMLRKCQSTNTLRLPKREEGSKPGYCENCRIKFEDFRGHITGRKHRKFAADDANFLQLDFLLSRMQRRTAKHPEKGRNIVRERRSSDEDYFFAERGG